MYTFLAAFFTIFARRPLPGSAVPPAHERWCRCPECEAATLKLRLALTAANRTSPRVTAARSGR